MAFGWIHRLLAALGKFQKERLLSCICESDDVFLEFSEKGNQNLTRELRKRGESIFVKKKQRGVTNDKITIIISCDRKGNEHLQGATSGSITSNYVSTILKDKLESNREL